jgi:hypothetical protein
MIKLGSIVAWLLVISGALRAGMGFYVAYNFSGDANIAAAKRYLGTVNSGEAIDKGLTWLLVGVFLGVLVNIAKRRETSGNE